MLQNCNAGKKLLSEKVLFPASRFDHQDTIFCLKIILMRKKKRFNFIEAISKNGKKKHKKERSPGLKNFFHDPDTSPFRFQPVACA